MDEWMVIGIYDFIDRPVDNVPSMSACTVWWDTWPLGSIFCFMNIRRLLRVWHDIIRLIRFRELGHTKSQSEFNTSEFSGLDITAVIASKMFLDAMADIFGNRRALCNTALDENIPWAKYHLLVDPKGAGKNVHLLQHIHKITGEYLKQYFWGMLKVSCWSDENWRVQVISNGCLGLWGPRWPLEG